MVRRGLGSDRWRTRDGEVGTNLLGEGSDEIWRKKIRGGVKEEGLGPDLPTTWDGFLKHVN